MLIPWTALLLTSFAKVVLATQCQSKKPVVITEEILLSVNDIKEADKIVDQPLYNISKDCKTPLHDFVGSDECATAAQAAVGLNLAFEAFGVTSFEQAATVIGQQIGESGGFQMNRKHYGTRQDGKDCSNGCALGQFGKGTYALWPSESLAAYAITEGIVTKQQASTLSGEEILGLINGNNNPHAYGPDVWFLKYGKPVLRADADWCPKNFASQLDDNELDAYKQCLAGTQTIPTDAILPDNYISTLVKGLKKQNCEAWEPESPVVMEYPPGVIAIDETPTVATPVTVSQPSQTTSVGEDWVYTGFSNTQEIVTTITVIGGNDDAGGSSESSDDSSGGKDHGQTSGSSTSPADSTGDDTKSTPNSDTHNTLDDGDTDSGSKKKGKTGKASNQTSDTTDVSTSSSTEDLDSSDTFAFQKTGMLVLSLGLMVVLH